MLRGDSVNREEALGLIQEQVKNINLIRHMLATEAVLRALARRWGEDEEKWGLTGLLHKVDWIRPCMLLTLSPDLSLRWHWCARIRS